MTGAFSLSPWQDTNLTFADLEPLSKNDGHGSHGGPWLAMAQGPSTV